MVCAILFILAKMGAINCVLESDNFHEFFSRVFLDGKYMEDVIE